VASCRRPSRAEAGEAQVWFHERVEPLDGHCRAKRTQNALHEPQVHGADHARVGVDEVKEGALPQADRLLTVVDPSFGGEPDVVEHADQVTNCFVVVRLRSGRVDIDKPLSPGLSSPLRFDCEVTLSAQARRQDFSE
jgi:hypothetical protein